MGMDFGQKGGMARDFGIVIAGGGSCRLVKGFNTDGKSGRQWNHREGLWRMPKQSRKVTRWMRGRSDGVDAWRGVTGRGRSIVNGFSETASAIGTANPRKRGVTKEKMLLEPPSKCSRPSSGAGLTIILSRWSGSCRAKRLDPRSCAMTWKPNANCKGAAASR